MENLIFMMGEFEAVLPADRLYCQNHMWAQAQPDSRSYRFGFTSYAVRLLQDVYFLDWEFDAPMALTVGMEIGSIESKKAESSLYSPVSGQLIEFNEALMNDPSAINTDKHGDGWLFDVHLAGDHERERLLTVEAYARLLDEVWVKTQRTIKGQLN